MRAIQDRCVFVLYRKGLFKFYGSLQTVLKPQNADCLAAFLKGEFMIDDKIKIKCSKCSQMFREPAQKVRNGFQTNCPHCNKLITFDTSAEDRNIRKALSSAKELRLVLEASRKAASIAQEGAPVPVMDRSQY